MTAFYFPIRQFQQGLRYIHEIDTAMTNLRKVTDETEESYRKFEIQANKVANALADTTTNVIKASTEWARIGYNMQESMQLAQDSIIYANVGDFEKVEDASQTLISAMKGFGLGVDEVRRIIDVYNEVGNKFAISSQGIGAALMRSASSLSTAGNTLEESVALVTAANTVIQNPERVGNGLKTVAMRIRGISDEGEDLSDLVPKLESSFNKLGLTLKKDDQTFKSTYEIFKDLASIWDQISDFDRANILELVAGKHQGNVIDSLIRNFSEAEKALSVGLSAQGSAVKEYENYLNSIDAKLATLKNNAIGFWQTSLDTQAIKGWIDAGSGLISILTSIVDKVGLLPPLFGLVGVGAVALSKDFRQAVISMNLFDSSVKKLTISLNTLKNVSKGVLAATGVGLLFSGLSFAIEKLISSIFKAKEEQQKLEEHINTITNSYSNQKDKIEQLVSTYTKLNDVTQGGKIFSDNEQEIEYRNTIEELSNLLPSVVDYIDSKGNKHLKNAQAIQEELKYARELAELNKQESKDKSAFSIDDNIDDLDSIRSRMLTNKQQAEIFKTNFDLFGTEEYLNKYYEYQKKYLTTQLEFADKLKEVQKDISNIISSSIDKSGLSSNNGLQDALNNIVSTIEDISKDKLDSAIVDINDALSNLANAKTIGAAESAVNKLKDAIKNLNANATEEQIESFILALTSSGSNIEDVVKQITKLSNGTSILTKEQKESLDTLKELSTTYNQLNEGQELSTETIINLVDKYPELLNSLRLENNQLKLNKDAVELLAKAKEQEFKDSIRLRQLELEDQKKALQQKLKIYSDEITALEYVSRAKSIAEAQYLEKQFNEYQNLLNQMRGLQALLDADLTKGLGKSTTSSKSSSPTPSYTDPIDAIIRQINAVAEARKEAIKILNDDISFAKSQEDYATALSKSNQLLEEHTQIVQDLTNANADLHAEANRIRSSSRFDTSNWFTANGEATVAYVNQFNKASKEQQEEMQKVFNQISKLKKAYNDNVISIHEYRKAINGLNISMKDLSENLATDVLNAYKDALKKQRDLVVSTINAQMKAEDERHKQVMDNLDAELKRIEDVINAKIRSLDDEWSEDDFNKELTKMQQESQDIQNRINELSLSDDIADKAKREDLEKQLQDQKLKIEEFKTKRSRDLQKQALKDQLDDYKKDVDAKKKAETTKYEAEKVALEKRLKEEQWYYDEMLSNEREFERLRTNIINGHVNEIQNKLTSFITEFKKVNEEAAFDIGQSYQEVLNIIGRLNSANSSLGSVSVPSPTSGSNTNTPKAQAWNEYLGNKKRAEQTFKNTGQWDAALNKRNQDLRDLWKFPDGSYDQLKNLKIYHGGGVVGGGGSPMAKLIDKMFNLKPNEEIAKLLKGEVVINPMRFQAKTPSIPSISKPVASGSTSPTVIHIDKFMPIDKVDRNTDVRKFFNDAEKELKNWGVVIKTT